MFARPVAAALVAVAGAGCPSPRRPAVQPLAAVTLEIGRDGGALRGVAADGAMTFAAIAMIADAAAIATTIEARRGAELAWRAELAGLGGPLVRTGDLLVAAIGGGGSPASLPVRGSPGAVLVGLAPATGAIAWRTAIDSSEWAVIAAIAPLPGGGVIAGGSFSGTLRAGAKVVSSGGASDGFVARVSAGGELAWLVRMGGPGADAIQGVAATGERIAIAGTYAPGADLLGTPLDPVDPKTRALTADGFVAELDPATARPRWAASFGGKLDDAVAGVAIDARGRVVVAAQAREVVHVNGRDLLAQGPADALVAWWDHDGAAGPAILIGGAGFDGATGIAAIGERVVVGCFFNAPLRLGPRAISPLGSDDGLVVALDGGAITEAWLVRGEGREELAALGPAPGGFVAGIAHTTGAQFGDDPLPAPRDPASGAAIVVRAAR